MNSVTTIVVLHCKSVQIHSFFIGSFCLLALHYLLCNRNLSFRVKGFVLTQRQKFKSALKQSNDWIEDIKMDYC